MGRKAKPASFVAGVSYQDLMINSDKDDIIEKLGLPEFVHRAGPEDHPDWTPAVYWHYPSRGLDVEFDSIGYGRVTTIHVYIRKFPGYRVAKYKGPKTRAALYKLFGQPQIACDIPKELQVPDKTTETWTTGYHVFYDKNDTITSFCIFTPEFANRHDSEDDDNGDENYD